MTNCFKPADIALPDFNKTNGTRWAVVACDQYTSEPEYWKGAEELVGDAPSVLNLILPEVYLKEVQERVPKIHQKMDEYLKNVLKIHKNSLIYLERLQSDGTIRHGIVGMMDLEEYNYMPGSNSLVRATEGTVLERIPPRQAVRRGGVLETPHIMILIDDPDKTVIEPVTARAGQYEVVYDFDLMQGGGHVKGYFLPAAEMPSLDKALLHLIAPEEMKKKYGRDDLAPLLYAVGDGNHSLATAKACYEELKQQLGVEAARKHPARYALCEIVNLHDTALNFEPIYRVVFGTRPEELLADLRTYIAGLHGTAQAQKLTACWQGKTLELEVPAPEKQLPVGTLQTFLDGWLKSHPGTSCDYIHNEDSLLKLSEKEGAVGFLFDGMKKDQLFNTVMKDGVLPRKTFSMGHAQDKRYCLECRQIL